MPEVRYTDGSSAHGRVRGVWMEARSRLVELLMEPYGEETRFVVEQQVAAMSDERVEIVLRAMEKE